MKFISFFLIGLAIALAEKTRYDGYRLLRLFPTDRTQVELLVNLENEPGFDVWNTIKGVNYNVDVALSPIDFLKYKVVFEQLGLRYEILDENLQNRIDEEERQLVKSRLENGNRVAGLYVDFVRINAWLEELATAYPAYLSTSNIGTTPEGRTMKTLKFKVGNPTKRAWIDCGIHAREWIAPATCTYIINKLVDGYNTGNAVATAILNKFELHFLPVHNPDGYQYSRDTSRLWRKSRAKTNNALCPGVDLNRNFGFQWLTGGSSTSACSDTYAGSAADSEPETKAVEAVINSAKFDAFITIHSYGQWFFTPWGYTTARPTDYNEQLRVANLAAAAIKSVDKMTYTTGPSAALLYVASGCSSDWAYGKAGIKYSYTIELRPGDGTADASYGFQLPQDRAPKVGEEIYAGLSALFDAI